MSWRSFSWTNPRTGEPQGWGGRTSDPSDALFGGGGDRGEKRYAVTSQGGRFAVIDQQTGLPAASDGRDLVGLDREDAQDIADVLNRDEDRRQCPLV